MPSYKQLADGLAVTFAFIAATSTLAITVYNCVMQPLTAAAIAGAAVSVFACMAAVAAAALRLCARRCTAQNESDHTNVNAGLALCHLPMPVTGPGAGIS